MFVLLRSQAGDYGDAIQLYTDSLKYQTQQTPDQTVARQSDLCLVLHNRAVCYLSTEQYTLCIKVWLLVQMYQRCKGLFTGL